MGIFFRIIILLAAVVGPGCASDPAPETGAQSGALAASSGSSASASAASAQTSQDSGDEMICRREQVTGTNFRRRVCRTRAEMQEAGEQSREFLNNQRTRTSEQ